MCSLKTDTNKKRDILDNKTQSKRTNTKLNYNDFREYSDCKTHYKININDYRNYSRNRRNRFIYLFSPFWILTLFFMPGVIPKIGCFILYIFSIFINKFSDHLLDLTYPFDFPKEEVVELYPDFYYIVIYLMNILKFGLLILSIILIIF